MENMRRYEDEKRRIERNFEIGKNLLYLTREDCMRVGPDIDETLEIVKRTLIDHGRGNYEMPAKIGIHPFSDVHLHAMPAYLPGQLSCGMKWISCFPRNPGDYGLP
ncbi:MAG: ornithine cyclodeaminase family protein, partial [Candidatus Accumulibacter sp.]|nr:ornithine cyclodeaminase family protein [Accumulibacter sp.]